jgi:hypothetical protein
MTATQEAAQPVAKWLVGPLAHDPANHSSFHIETHNRWRLIAYLERGLGVEGEPRGAFRVSLQSWQLAAEELEALGVVLACVQRVLDYQHTHFAVLPQAEGMQEAVRLAWEAEGGSIHIVKALT